MPPASVKNVTIMAAQSIKRETGHTGGSWMIVDLFLGRLSLSTIFKSSSDEILNRIRMGTQPREVEISDRLPNPYHPRRVLKLLGESCDNSYLRNNWITKNIKTLTESLANGIKPT